MGLLESAQRIYKYKDGVYIRGYIRPSTLIEKIEYGKDITLLYTEPDCPLNREDIISENGSEYYVKDCQYLRGSSIQVNIYYLMPKKL